MKRRVYNIEVGNMTKAQARRVISRIENAGTRGAQQHARKTRASMLPSEPSVAHYKYGEGRVLDEARAHIDKTYGGHYVGEDNVQALDLIFATGHGESFCIGNALKYLSRFGKKNGKNREDLLKALHYTVLALHALDRANK